MEEEKELYKRVDEVAHYIWDPIGISGTPEVRDEYYPYLPELFMRVKQGELKEIVDFMKVVVVERMGLAFDETKAKESVEIMLKWREVIKHRT